jgi:hypothetical protein
VNNLIANVPIRIEAIISIIKNINEQGAPKEWSTYSKFPKVLQKNAQNMVAHCTDLLELFR